MEKLIGKNRHDHTLTDILKVLIFALFLLLPFFCFIPTGLYYGFNEHAVNETTTEVTYKYQSNEVNTIDDLVDGNIYYLNTLTLDGTETNVFQLNLNLLKVDTFTFNANSTDLSDIIYDQYSNDNYNCINVYNDEDDTGFYVCFTNDTAYTEIYYSECELTFDHVIFSINTTGLNDFKSFCTLKNYLPQYTDYNVIESVDTNVQDTISNKMYQAWEGVWQSPLFNWTNNTPLNTSLNGFISIFGISTNSYIGNALIWLLSITAIYIVIDIVIGVFKWLTHLIGNK